MPRQHAGDWIATRVSPGAGVLAILAGLGLSFGAAPRAAVPATGSISGQVHLVTKSTRRLVSAGAYPSRTITPAVAQEASETTNVVVFVQAPATGAPAMRATIRQAHEEFVPHLVAVTVGSTVDFPNDDLIFHNVFSLSRSSTFDLGRYPRGQSKSRTFAAAGLVKVYCHLHSNMSAAVRVFNHPYFAIPDEQGRFSIAGLPPRHYDVVAWHERAGEVTLSTDVTAGRTASLTFSLPLQDAR
jgi:plastocyanin